MPWPARNPGTTPCLQACQLFEVGLEAAAFDPRQPRGGDVCLAAELALTAPALLAQLGEPLAESQAICLGENRVTGFRIGCFRHDASR